MNPKTRMRIGVKLGWPFANAAIFVVYVPNDTFTKIADAFGTIRLLLSSAGQQAIADKLVCEAS